jgi:hypothetical protein
VLCPVPPPPPHLFVCDVSINFLFFYSRASPSSCARMCVSIFHHGFPPRTLSSASPPPSLPSLTFTQTHTHTHTHTAAVNHEQIRGLVELGTLMHGWGSSLPSSTTLEREKDLSRSGANSAQSSLMAPSASRNSSSFVGGPGSLESYQEPHPER